MFAAGLKKLVLNLMYPLGSDNKEDRKIERETRGTCMVLNIL